MDISDDAFLGGSVKILQPARGYRAGIDAVFLAAAVPVGPSLAGRVLDVGAGVGTAGLCALRRCTEKSAVLIEREPVLVELAGQNIRRNGLMDRAAVLLLDIATARAGDLAALGVGLHSFDHVIANPPFHVEGNGTAAEVGLKARAHAMDKAGFELWCKFFARMVKPRGTVTVIHKAEALEAILAGFSRRFGGAKVFPLFPRVGEAAIRVIVQGVAGSRAPLSLQPGIILHEADNSFTDSAARVLRFGGGLDLGYGGASRDLAG